MDKMLYMGISGSFLIAAIICLRHFFSQQIPKRFLVVFWIFAIARLLLPISIPIRLPAEYSWNITKTSASQQISKSNRYESPAANQPVYPDSAKKAQTRASVPEASFWVKYILITLWATVAIFLAIRISIKHIRSCRLYNMSLPICDERAVKWMQEHHNIRNVALRKSELIKSPLTYGIIHPVILLPSEINLNEEEFLCIMEHEWIHIRRKDVFVKYLLCLTICIYWFHPLVWMMAVFLNRDIEFASDEEVSRTCSQHCKTAYALALIRLAQESRQSVWPLNACFARHSEIEERIRFIMNTKRYSKKAAVVAAGNICCIMTAFTASAQETPGETASQVEHTRQSGAEIFPNESGAAEKQNIQENTTETEASDSLAGMGEVSDYGKESLASAANAAGEYTNISKEQQAAGEQIAELAKLYIGNPYKAGGTDLEYGTDSIGFVKAVYALAGIELPADIQALAAVGTEVPLETLIAGDLIIYSSADGENRFFHVAVYDGSGRAIHASNRKTGIKISDYDYREITKAIRIIR